MLAGICPRVVRWKVNRHGRLVIVGESGHQLFHHIWSLVRQVPPLTRVGRDVEQPDIFVVGRFVERRDDFEVPPGTRESGKYLRIKIGSDLCFLINLKPRSKNNRTKMGLNALKYLWGDPVSMAWVSC